MHEGTETSRISAHAFLPCGDVAKAGLVDELHYNTTQSAGYL
jgi:hypothetical protein